MDQHPEYFRGKKMLDIGCNSGFITISVAKKFKPSTIIGVDIDSELINTARRQVEKQKTDPNLTEVLKVVTFRTVSLILIFEFKSLD